MRLVKSISIISIAVSVVAVLLSYYYLNELYSQDPYTYRNRDVWSLSNQSVWISEQLFYLRALVASLCGTGLSALVFAIHRLRERRNQIP